MRSKKKNLARTYYKGFMYPRTEIPPTKPGAPEHGVPPPDVDRFPREGKCIESMLDVCGG